MSAGLSNAEIERYRCDGFLILPSFVDATLLASLRSAYDDVITGAVRAEGDRMLGGVTRQVMFPSRAHPLFDRNEAITKALSIGRELLGTRDVLRSFDMLIDKPPGHPHATPWHQDMAYAEHPFAAPGSSIVAESVQFWVALDDVDEENGCMHFVPGFHTRPLLLHRVAAGDAVDDSRLLELVDPSVELADAETVAAPLSAGGATVHSYGTPHFTAPNQSADRPRRAYIFNIATVDAARAIASHDRPRSAGGAS